MMQAKPTAKDLLMRYSPAAAALSLLVAVTSSMSHSAAPEKLDARATMLLQEGQAALAAGDTTAAIDAYESALTVEPGSVSVLLALADATRQEGMQGKALHYYRVALSTDPRNVAAITGEGLALAEKGATEKANRNLVRLQALCGKDCATDSPLAQALARKPAPKMVTATSVTAKTLISEN